MDSEGPGGFRARITHLVASPEDPTPQESVHADVAAVCGEICARLEAFSES